jgi:hypothetical protein
MEIIKLITLLLFITMLIILFLEHVKLIIKNEILKQMDFKIGSYAYLDNNECVQILQKKTQSYQVIVIDKKIEGNLLIVDKSRISHKKH